MTTLTYVKKYNQTDKQFFFNSQTQSITIKLLYSVIYLCVDLGQQITIYRLKPVDGEILIEETGTVIYVIVRN